MLKDAVPLDQCARALVVKLEGCSEALLAGPVLSALKARGVEADALVYDDAAAILEGHPALDRLHVVSRGGAGLSQIRAEARLLAGLRRRRYALLVHLCGHGRGAWLARTLGVRFSVAPHLAQKGRLWRRSFTHHYLLAERRHQVELNLDALRRIGLYPQAHERRLAFVPAAAAEARVAPLVQAPYVHVHTERLSDFWTATELDALIERIAGDGLRVALTSERGGTAYLANARLSFPELGALSARARAFFGAESTPMHLACAVGTPVVAFFAPGGEHERGPWGVPYRVLRESVATGQAHAALREVLAQ